MYKMIILTLKNIWMSEWYKSFLKVLYFSLNANILSVLKKTRTGYSEKRVVQVQSTSQGGEFYLHTMKVGYIMKQTAYNGTIMMNYFYAKKTFEVERSLK